MLWKLVTIYTSTEYTVCRKFTKFKHTLRISLCAYLISYYMCEILKVNVISKMLIFKHDL
jgi:hypothetical protein